MWNALATSCTCGCTPSSSLVQLPTISISVRGRNSPPSTRRCGRPVYLFASMTYTPPAVTARWSMLTRVPGTRRSCSSRTPLSVSWFRRWASRSSPTAPRCQARVLCGSSSAPGSARRYGGARCGRQLLVSPAAAGVHAWPRRRRRHRQGSPARTGPAVPGGQRQRRARTLKPGPERLGPSGVRGCLGLQGRRKAGTSPSGRSGRRPPGRLWPGRRRSCGTARRTAAASSSVLVPRDRPQPMIAPTRHARSAIRGNHSRDRCARRRASR